MRLLVIGGTAFLGRATVQAALDRGWSVTTFNRGATGPDVAGVEPLHGDRADDTALDQLAGRSFDGVVDTCGFVPRVVGRSVRVLAGSGAHYVYVSSISACPSWPAEVARDGAPGHPCPSDADEDAGDYGVLKAGCERAVTEVMGDRSTVVRAGLILGPHENVGRLTWWLSRFARAGEVIGPGDPARPMQLVDARDIAAFMLDAVEYARHGTFNVTGPPGNTTMGAWLGAVAEAVGGETVTTWVDDDFLLARDVAPWTELPLWMPPGQGADQAWGAETAAAERAGLRVRDPRETVRDTWEWMKHERKRRDEVHPAEGDGRFKGNGMAPARERQILADWHAR